MSSEASERAKKRLKAFSGIGLSTNQRQLAKALHVLHNLPEEDVEEVLGAKRWQLKAAVDELWSECGFELELEIRPGTLGKLLCASLAKTLHMMVRKFPEFREQLLELWERKPCTRAEPYSLLIYGDELVPGNVLHLEQSRKLFGCEILAPRALRRILAGSRCSACGTRSRRIFPAACRMFSACT